MRIEVGKSSFLVKLGDTAHVRVTIDPGVNKGRDDLIPDPLDIEGRKPIALNQNQKSDKWAKKLSNIEERLSQVERKLESQPSDEQKTNLKQEIEFFFETKMKKEFDARLRREVRKDHFRDIQEATADITEAISVLSVKTDERLSVVEKQVLNISSKNHSDFVNLTDKIKQSESELTKTFVLVARKEASDSLRELRIHLEKLEVDRNNEIVTMNKRLNEFKSQITKERDKKF